MKNGFLAILGLTLCIGVFLVFPVFGDPDSPPYQNPVVKIMINKDSSEPKEKPEYYTPSLLLIAQGTSVVWHNSDGVDHTVTSGTSIGGSDGRFDSRLIAAQEEYTFKFVKPGEYGYYCKIHPWMNAAIVVAPESLFKISSKKGLFDENQNIELLIDMNLNLKNTYYFAKGTKSVDTTITIYDSAGREIDKTVLSSTGEITTTQKFPPINTKKFSGPFTAELRLVTHSAELISVTNFKIDSKMALPSPPSIPIIIADRIPPKVVAPSEILVITESIEGSIVSFDVQATDNVGVINGPTCDYSSGSFFGIGVTKVTCVAKDAAGNSGSITFTVTVSAPSQAESGPGSIPPSTPTRDIPSWIKTNAQWWSGGQIDDQAFVGGIEFLIKEDIMKIPQTPQGESSGSNVIPSWIKNNAQWWAEGQIDDDSFVQGIQFLIREGIMKIG